MLHKDISIQSWEITYEHLFISICIQVSVKNICLTDKVIFILGKFKVKIIKWTNGVNIPKLILEKKTHRVSI